MSDTTEAQEFRITGGAGPSEAAAIAAVISQVVADEQAAAAIPQSRRRLSAWLIAGRQDAFIPPSGPISRISRQS